jgi:hypothetical protein
VSADVVRSYTEASGSWQFGEAEKNPQTSYAALVRIYGGCSVPDAYIVGIIPLNLLDNLRLGSCFADEYTKSRRSKVTDSK